MRQIKWISDADDAGFGRFPRATRERLCQSPLCAVPRDRPGRSKPAEDRASVPDPAPALSHCNPRAEALAEGINTGHAAMPEFVLDPDQIHDLLSYLKTLE
jgi:hypothetical protein